MDDVVRRAMARWPDVPAVHGWLSLDRRGRWRLRGEPIAHPGTIAFIARNYAADEAGRWFFQNGPQRVFVDLEHTPWVWSVDARGDRLVGHTGEATRAVRAAALDDGGGIVLDTGLGAGLVHDRDLPLVLERLRAGPDGRDGGEAALVAALADPGRAAELGLRLRWNGAEIPVEAVRGSDLERRFGFVARPRAA